jgi:arylsulfate sulfotransferase
MRSGHRKLTCRPGPFRRRRQIVIVCAAIGLSACGGGGDTPVQQPTSQAASSAVLAEAIEPGVTPFIAFASVLGTGMQKLAGVEFTIAPKDGAVSKPIHVRYSLAALARQGRVVLSNRFDFIKFPVFGLYPALANQVSVELDFMDGSVRNLPLVITTAPYADPNGIYDHPTILRRRAAGTALGFDFFVLKSALGAPVIVDTDGEVRWIGAGIGNSISSTLDGDGFIIGNEGSPILPPAVVSPTAYSPTVYRLGLDGSLSQGPLPNPPFLYFHHNIDYGKQGLLAEVDTDNDGVDSLETSLTEITTDGKILNSWDLAAILSTYMRDQGDDPTLFVRPGVDWFHMNAATYDRSDDSLIVSSRENFLIKLDYSTGNIVWIFGDPTKYWYTFPSLRAKALTLQPGGLYPIGQHAVSITSNGLVMVFNDGEPSFNQPPGAPTGESRPYSAVSAYSVDPVSRKAQEVWRFDYGQSIFSPICSSAYEASAGSLLVDYAFTAGGSAARLVGLDGGHNVVFDFQYPTQGCNTSWNATPIGLDNFAIM